MIHASAANRLRTMSSRCDSWGGPPYTVSCEQFLEIEVPVYGRSVGSIDVCQSASLFFRSAIIEHLSVSSAHFMESLSITSVSPSFDSSSDFVITFMRPYTDSAGMRASPCCPLLLALRRGVRLRHLPTRMLIAFLTTYAQRAPGLSS